MARFIFRPLLGLFFILLTSACSENGTGNEPEYTQVDEADNPDAIDAAITSEKCRNQNGSCAVGQLTQATEIHFKEGDTQNSYQFRDAQDLADRFETAFLRPFIESKGLDPKQYQIDYLPRITRENFGQDFKVFVEPFSSTTSAYLTQNGTFWIENLDVNSSFDIRFVRLYSLRLQNLESNEVNFACLAFEANTEVTTGDKHGRIELGGINRFKFFYLEGRDFCDADMVDSNLDHDGDGIADEKDFDDDNDGVVDGQDCAPNDASKWEIKQLYLDSDFDGLGAGSIRSVCIGNNLKGYSENSTDCDDDDFMARQFVRYSFVDHDLDGFTIPSEGEICGAHNYLPKGYSNNANGHDCDDQDRTVFSNFSGFLDGDGDGIGAGEKVELCAGSVRPAELVESAGDCNDKDPNLYQEMLLFADSDFDGFGSGEEKKVCASSNLPKGYSKNSSDCNDRSATEFQLHFVYRDFDSDGYGAGDLVDYCGNHELPSRFSKSSTDCDDQDASKFQLLSYSYTDLDQDGLTLGKKGKICSGDVLPATHSNIGVGDDCDDSSSEKFQWLVGFRDIDGDGYGSGDSNRYCSGNTLPQGVVSNAGDCNDSDAGLYRFLDFRYLDQDGDGYTLNQTGRVCAGVILPSGVSNVSLGPDCDDLNPSKYRVITGFIDNDGDGIGAGLGQQICAGSSPEIGMALTTGDCNDNDENSFRELTYYYRDRDLDGYTVPENGFICAGNTLPDGYLTQENGLDCNDGLDSVFQILPYGFTDKDGDNYYVQDSGEVCSGTTLRSGFKLYAGQIDCNDHNSKLFEIGTYFVDEDGDGIGSSASQQVCGGSDIPSDYSETSGDMFPNDPSRSGYQGVKLFDELAGQILKDVFRAENGEYVLITSGKNLDSDLPRFAISRYDAQLNLIWKRQVDFSPTNSTNGMQISKIAYSSNQDKLVLVANARNGTGVLSDDSNTFQIYGNSYTRYYQFTLDNLGNISGFRNLSSVNPTNMVLDSNGNFLNCWNTSSYSSYTGNYVAHAEFRYEDHEGNLLWRYIFEGNCGQVFIDDANEIFIMAKLAKTAFGLNLNSTTPRMHLINVGHDGVGKWAQYYASGFNPTEIKESTSGYLAITGTTNGGYYNNPYDFDFTFLVDQKPSGRTYTTYLSKDGEYLSTEEIYNTTAVFKADSSQQGQWRYANTGGQIHLHFSDHSQEAVWNLQMGFSGNIYSIKVLGDDSSGKLMVFGYMRQDTDFDFGEGRDLHLIGGNLNVPFLLEL